MLAAINWTPELQEAFVHGIIAGESIDSIAKSNGISAVSFYRQRVEDEEFDTTIARAQEAAQEREVDGFKELADTADAENYNAIKLKIWTRMWIAGKRKPKKYGDNAKLALTGADGEGPVEISIADRLNRARKE